MRRRPGTWRGPSRWSIAEVTPVYIDADACPVKQEVYKVAQRYKLKVFLVSNSGMNAPGGDWPMMSAC